MDVRNHTDNAQIAEFLEHLVHDTREPLRSIGAFTELLAESAGDHVGDDGRRALAEIPAGVSRITKMLEGLSGYALALRETGECNSPASLQSAFRIVLAEFDKQIQDSGATVSGTDLPKVNVSLERLMQLMKHLIGNSLRFRSEIAPVIQVSAAMEEPGRWTIRLQDNGIGIPPEQREAVFKPFMRVHGRKYGGVGLGLSIVKRIIEAHGGTIWIEAAPERGSSFVFTLPEA